MSYGFPNEGQYVGSNEINPYAEQYLQNTEGKKRGCGCWVMGCGIGCLGLIVLLIVGSIFFYFFCLQGKPLEVSPETTIITEPLKSDGKSVDFFKAVEEIYEPKVDTDQNGFKSVLQAYGRGAFDHELQPDRNWEYGEMCKKLGVDPNAIPPHALFEMQDDDSATWFQQLGPGLDVVQSAAMKPYYFVPMIRRNESELTLTSQPLSVFVFHARLSQILRLRALQRFAAGETDGAWNDMLATIRLYRTVTCNQTFAESFTKETSVSAEAQTPISKIVNQHWTPEQLSRAVADLESLPKWTDRKTLLKMVQFGLLDALAGTDDIRNLANSLFEGGVSPDMIKAAEVIGFDWNLVAQKLNEQFAEYEKKLDAAGSDQDKQLELFGKEIKLDEEGIEMELKELFDPKSVDPMNVIAVSGRSKLAGELAGRIFTSLVGQVFRLELEEEARCQILRAALALERFKLEKEVYPAKLDELELKPLEPNLPIEYEKSEKGYRLSFEKTVFEK